MDKEFSLDKHKGIYYGPESELIIDDRFERSKKKTLTQWIYSIFPLSRAPYGFDSIDMQLKLRKEFSFIKWNEFVEKSMDQIIPILKLLQEACLLPNDHLLPKDSLILIMRCSIDYHASERFFFYIKKRFNFIYTQEDFEMMFREDWTVGDFIANFIKRQKAG